MEDDRPSGAAELLIRKQFATEIKAEGGNRELAFTISTGTVDRMGDTIAPDGWELDNFRAGGSILWAHDNRGLPVAKPTFVGVVAGRLKGRGQFAPPELYGFADTVYEMLRQGYLKSTSVGFRPIEGAFNKDRGGYDFTRQELLEWSIVPVPANPEALLEAKAAGINLDPLKEWAERTLDSVSGAGVWIPRHLVEQSFRTISGNPVSVTSPSVSPSPISTTTDAGERGSAGAHAASLPGSTPGPATSKAGRVLSAANEGRVKAARDAAQTIASALDEVLAGAGKPEEDEDHRKQIPQPALRLRQTPITKEVIDAVVTDAVNAVIRRARGRLD